MSARPRVALAGVFHESNTFVARRTPLDAFRRAWHEGPALVQALEGTQTVMGGCLAGAARAGLEVRPAVHAWATPSGPVEAAAFAALAEALGRGLRAAGPVDGLLLELHGALVADGVEAADATLAAVAREAVGAVPIVCVVDPHANLSPALVEAVDALLAYRTNPHVDMAAQGERAAGLLARVLAGEVAPVTAFVPVPVTAPAIAQATDDEPLAGLLRDVAALEREPGIVTASLAFGFAHADVPELGMAGVVTADGDGALARAGAERLAAAAWAARTGFARALVSADEAVRLAADGPGPIALADTGDNVGGGSPGDSTVLAAAVLAHGGVRAVTTVHDPAAVIAAEAAGVGATVRLSLGAPALAIEATVQALCDGAYVNDGPLSAGVTFDMGRVAVLQVAALTVVVQSVAVMANDRNMLRSVGVDVAALDAVILKGAAAVRAGWAPAVRRIVDVATPGPTTSDLSSLTYRRVPAGTWPLSTG